MQEITAQELKSNIDAGDDIQLIDVRQPDEHAFAKIDGSRLIPLGEIASRIGEIEPERNTVIYCRSGVRSAQAISLLMRSGFQGKLANLTGGILAWSDEVDPTIPKY